MASCQFQGILVPGKIETTEIQHFRKEGKKENRKKAQAINKETIENMNLQLSSE